MDTIIFLTNYSVYMYVPQEDFVMAIQKHFKIRKVKGIVEFCFQTANAFKVHGYCSYSYL